MSGGVDSAVAALLERERGAEVVGVTLKLWADPETDGAKACCSPEAVLGARAVAHSIDVPHLTLDLEEEFRRRVVGAFLSGYAAGATPNPCIVCNGEVRIAAMIDLAERLGATHLVTGHYARIVDDGSGPLLAPAADTAKDQSYMLAALPPALLDSGALPAHRAEQARGARDRRPPRPRGRPQAREPGPLLPRRPGQGAVPPPPRRPARARGRRPRPLGPRDRPPLRPPQLHRRPAPRDRRLGTGARSTCSPPTRTRTRSPSARREELAASAVRLRDAVLHRDGRTGRRGAPALPLDRGPGRDRSGGDRRSPRARASSSASRSSRRPPGRPRCSWPARRSSAMAPWPVSGLLACAWSWRSLAAALTQRENAVPFSPLTCFLLSPLQA